MSTHYVKSWPHLFRETRDGKKKHDFRDRRERDYRVGDYMVLQEFDFIEGKYTGNEILCMITYMTDVNTPCALSSAVLDNDYVVLSLDVIDRDRKVV